MSSLLFYAQVTKKIAWWLPWGDRRAPSTASVPLLIL
jgi:hypothetical protein